MSDKQLSFRPRCAWAKGDLYEKYHDHEWGRPVYDDGRLFEFLILEGAQAGLAWITILQKRQAYRRAFADFDPRKVAKFTPKMVETLLKDSGIVRNRLKIESAIINAKAFLKVQQECGSFSSYVWSFVGGKPLVRYRRSIKSVPVRTKHSDALSRDLKRRGFKFVGSTICYAYMQACGLVNDHVAGCHLARSKKQRGAR